jgi:hypothetical protein
MILIDAQWCMQRKACRSQYCLCELFPHPRPLLEVLTRNDGPWATVSAGDRIWVGAQVLFIPFMARMLARAVAGERAVGREPSAETLAVLAAFQAGRLATASEASAAWDMWVSRPMWTAASCSLAEAAARAARISRDSTPLQLAVDAWVACVATTDAAAERAIQTAPVTGADWPVADVALAFLAASRSMSAAAAQAREAEQRAQLEDLIDLVQQEGR